MDYIYLLLGFTLLLYSGNLLVKSGVALASHFKISTLVVGVTVVSFGTSAPELFVSIDAALNGSPDIALGNVVGSNISNIALVLGFTALLMPLPIRTKSIRYDWSFMMSISILFFLFSLNGNLQSFEGIVFILLLTAFMIWTIWTSRATSKKQSLTEIPPAEFSKLTAILLIGISSIGLYLGADLLVDSAKNIALHFGVSERVVGLTIIAFGTSVPELATSALAAYKKETDISVGNIIGSNIFNILGVLGFTSIIKNISVSEAIIHFDILIMLAISLLLFLLILPLQKGKLHRWKGALLLLVYFLYVHLVFLK